MTKKELIEIIADMPDDAVISISGHFKYQYFPIVEVHTRLHPFTPDLYPGERVPAHIFFTVDDRDRKSRMASKEVVEEK